MNCNCASLVSACRELSPSSTVRTAYGDVRLDVTIPLVASMPFSELGVTPRSSCSTNRSGLRLRGLLGRHRPVPVGPPLVLTSRLIVEGPERTPRRSTAKSHRHPARPGSQHDHPDPTGHQSHPACPRGSPRARGATHSRPTPKTPTPARQSHDPTRPALPGASPHAAPLGSTWSSYPASVPRKPLDRVNKLPRSSPPSLRVTSCNHRSCVGRTRLRYFTADRHRP